nr:hypothetical protein BaRGS_027532 [Batillaria attramentaria]
MKMMMMMMMMMMGFCSYVGKMLTIELHGNWDGDETEVWLGLTEIQLLDSAGCVMPVPERCVSTKNTKQESGSPAVLFNGEENVKHNDCDCSCYKTVKRVVTSAFTRYGKFVGRHPLPFIILPILIFGGLGAGLVALDTETDMETIYFPKDSRAMDDRQTVRDTFPDLNNMSYNAFSQSDTDEAATLIFKAKGDDILNPAVLAEIQTVVDQVKNITATSDSRTLTHNDVCARAASQCVVDGEYVLSTAFQTALAAGTVTYPYWVTPGGATPLFTAIGGVTTQSGILRNATVLKISFKLLAGSVAWEKNFLTLAATFDPALTEVTYETPDSLSEELDKSTSGDIWLFSLTITIMLTYASIFVNIVGVIPFLIIGIGVDDMFLMMSSWSETLGITQLTVPARLGATFAGAGIGITITSITDFLAFVIGTTSVFRSVTNFSLYAGVAVLFCYICNATLFGGCLTFHGRRVYSWRHFATCLVTKSRDELKAKGKSTCQSLCCGGSIPEKERADESICEKLPRLYLPKVILFNVVRVIIILLFLGYLAAAIYGVINLKQGLILQSLVLESSYYHKFLGMYDEYFPTRLPVGFIVNDKIDYAGAEGQQFLDLLQAAHADAQIDSSFERCWLTSYMNSTFYDSSAPQDFTQNLKSFLLAVASLHPRYRQRLYCHHVLEMLRMV